MIVSSVEDVRKKEVPIWEVIACFTISALSAVAGLYMGEKNLTDIVLSLIPGTLIVLVALVSREQIGYGDGLLILGSGPALGLYDLGMGTVIALFSSGVISGALLIMKKAGKKTRIPFVPFITFGMGVMLLAKI